ncbi:MAG TPA: hypothetical protein VLQ45_21010 [Thermoanaerobaculia bacterium]|nr:hypothetical protein [Thermoanaerobaculia bacterium]
MRARLYLFVALGSFSVLGGGRAALAWTPSMQVIIAREASRLAPGDLYRQIEKHRRVFEEAATAPFSDTDPGRHMKNADGSGQLDRVIVEEVARAIALIQAHRPFEEVVRQLGIVSHYVADANNPLATSAADAEEGQYFIDFLRYAEKTEPKFPLVFYGVRPGLENRADVSPLLAETFRRGRELYPLVGREYRRIGFASGIGRFDDRSTAFGAASLSFSHAVTDVALVLRYIWIRAGGVDDRTNLPAGGTRLVIVPRAGRTR